VRRAGYGEAVTVRAVVLPGTPLLVPGAAGGALVLEAVREATLSALAGLLAGSDDVVVVAPGPSATPGPARASLAAFGVADAWLDPVWARATGHPDLPTAGPAASVGLLALAGAGRTAPVEVVELDGAAPVARCREVGAVAARRGAGLVVVHDPRSTVSDVVLDGFVDPGWRVRSHASTGEYEGRAYEVRAYEDREAARTVEPGAVSR
jgi:hypothetical protein